MNEIPGGPDTAGYTDLQRALHGKYSLKPDAQLNGAEDFTAFMQVLIQTRGKYFFPGDTMDTIVPKFEDVMSDVNILPVTKDHRNRLSLECDIDFAGHASRLVAQAYIMHHGKPGKPVIIKIPGYGGSSHAILDPLMLGQFKDYTHVGFETFHGVVGAVKVANHIQNLQTAFALSSRMLSECITTIHKAGLKVFVVGTSFGGKVISAHLNELAENETIAPLKIADGYVPVQGGLFVPTFTGRHYTRRMLYSEIARHEGFQLGYAFPQQSALPSQLASRVHAGVNTTNNPFMIQGTHFSGPACNILGLRRYIHDAIA